MMVKYENKAVCARVKANMCGGAGGGEVSRGHGGGVSRGHACETL